MAAFRDKERESALMCRCTFLEKEWGKLAGFREKERALALMCRCSIIWCPLHVDQHKLRAEFFANPIANIVRDALFSCEIAHEHSATDGDCSYAGHTHAHSWETLCALSKGAPKPTC
jgi:hypothetical protein